MLTRITCLLLILACNSVIAATNPTQRSVLITGGLSGIGRAMAIEFKKEGWNVWVTSRDPQKYEAIAGINIRQLDLTNPTNVKQLVKEIKTTDGHLDVLINNAGYAVLGPQETTSVEQARQLMDVNVIGPFMLTQEVLPLMRSQKGGYIINVSSTSGIRALPGLGIYAASKMALEGLSEALAAEVAPWNIKVVIIEPGTVNNNWVQNSLMADNINSYPGYKGFTNKLQKTLSKKAVEVGQQPQEIATLAVKIVNTPNPNLRYQTSSTAAALATEILIDPTGNKIREKTLSFANELYEIQY